MLETPTPAPHPRIICSLASSLQSHCSNHHVDGQSPTRIRRAIRWPSVDHGLKRPTRPNQLSGPDRRIYNLKFEMDDHQSSQAGDDSSSYGKPDHDTAMDSMFSDTDTNLVVGAGRSLKTMLGDLAAVLQEQAHAKIFISGEIHLRIDEREDYTLSLVMEDTADPSSLKVKIGKRPTTNGTCKPISALKRKHRAASVDFTDEDLSQTSRDGR
jgi:hypothetical protein